MPINSCTLLFRIILILMVMFSVLVGCAPSLYKTKLQPEERAIICGYSVPWERSECLDEADQQIEWCKEALGQEHDCWNTLLGDYSAYRGAYPVPDSQYFEILHDPTKVKPLLDRIKHDHPIP
jgi:hypothetical protein